MTEVFWIAVGAGGLYALCRIGKKLLRDILPPWK
jgi:hypothetical protein